MCSRAQHRRLANKAKDETAMLKERLTALASRDLPARKEIYEILEIVAAIAGDIEDAGDDLVNGFSRYKMGRHTFQGGGYLGDLMRSLMHFISRWNRTKDRLGDLKKKQRDLLDPSKGLLPPPPPPPQAPPPPSGGGNGQPPAGNGPATPRPGESAGENPEDSAKPPAHDPDDHSGGAEHG